MAFAGNDGRVLANVQTAPGETATEHSPDKNLPLLMLGALGVVYGDIGTSPIYALREALHASTGGEQAAPEQVLGVLSLIFWALTVIVTVKYIAFVLRADNRGEGGTLSLMALARGSFRDRPAWILIIGILGASLFFGDAVITPAISVLSAVEGIKVVTPDLRAIRRAADAVDPRHPVLRAKVRDGQGGSGVRPRHAAVVHRDRHFRPHPHYRRPGRACGDQSASYRLLPCAFAGHVLRDDRRGVPGGDRRRGALCGSWPFRAQADRPCLAVDRLSLPASQLFRAGRFRARATTARSVTRSSK